MHKKQSFVNNLFNKVEVRKHMANKKIHVQLRRNKYKKSLLLDIDKMLL